MALIQLVKTVLFFAAFIVVFINWKWALVLIVLATILHAIPYGPFHVVRIVSGLLFSGGLIYLFIDWRIGLLLMIASVFVARFGIRFVESTLTEGQPMPKRRTTKTIIGIAFVLFAIKPLLVSIEEASLAYSTYGYWEYNHLLIGFGAFAIGVAWILLGYSFLRQSVAKGNL